MRRSQSKVRTWAVVRASAIGLSSAMVLLTVLACLGTVEGERSETGACPEHEVCSDATPAGLTFVGTMFYDDAVADVRLGPVLAGGRFDLGFRTTDWTRLPEFEIAVDDAERIASEPPEGEFFGGGDGAADLVQAHVTLRGLAPGRTFVRVVDAADGTLLDRLAINVYELERVAITTVRDPERDFLIEGCEEMLAVRLIAKDGPTEFRAIDQEIALRVNGEPMERERNLWDCFLHTPAEDQIKASIEVDVAGRTFSRLFAIQTLEESGMTECPARPTD